MPIFLASGAGSSLALERRMYDRRVFFVACLLGGCLAPWDSSKSTTTPGGGDTATNPAAPIVKSACGTTAGHAAIHRLNNAEYDNTVRDLLFSQLVPAQSFPPDPVGANGYSNDSDALDTFAQLVNLYYQAALTLSAELIASKGKSGGAYARIAPCAATMTVATQSDCAASTIATFGARAFRRPLTSSEQAAFMTVFNQSGNFDTGLSDAVVALLLDPGFLFVSYEAPQAQDPDAQYALNDYQLAARLSYFLWQTMPDDELVQLAAAGTLHTDAVLTAQVARMLADDKITDMLKTLREEFVGLSVISGGSLAGLDDSLRLSMIEETDRFLQDMVQSDSGYMSLITSQTSFVNQALATQYGIPFTGTDPTEFVKVTLPADQRVGLLTQASVLTATAGSTTTTHPVKRGLWVTQHILCSQPPAPPPNVPELPTTLPANATVKQVLDAHAANPVCAGCHAIMDPIGLSLENYDPFGQWRTTYANGATVDATGALPTGQKFTDGVDLFHQLPAMPQVQACITKSFVGFALARAVSSTDDVCVANALGTYAARSGAKFSDLINGIVTSNQFRMQQGEAQ